MDGDDMGVRGIAEGDDSGEKRRILSSNGSACAGCKAVLLRLDDLGRHVACVALYNYPTRLARDWARVEAAAVQVVNRAPSAPPGAIDASADVSAGACESAEEWSLELAISLDEIEAAPLAVWRARLRRGLAALLRVSEARVELPGAPRERDAGWGVVAPMQLCDHEGADYDSERNAHDAATELDRTHEAHGGGPWNLTTAGEATSAAVEADSLAAEILGAEWHLSFWARLRREMGLGGRGQRTLLLGLAACVLTLAIAQLASRRFAGATKPRSLLQTCADASRRPKGAHLPSSSLPTPIEYDSSHTDVKGAEAALRRRRGFRRRALLGVGAYWLNVHFVWNSLDASHSHATTGIGQSQAGRYYSAGAAIVGGMTILSLTVASAIVVYGVQGTLSVRQLSMHGVAAQAERGARSTANALLETDLVAREAKLITAVALLTGMSIDTVALLPWTDDRFDGLPQKPLLLACALTIVLSEGPMLALKAMYQHEARTGLLLLFSIAVSVVRLYRALFHVRLLRLVQRCRVRGHATRSGCDAKEAPTSTGFMPGRHDGGGGGGTRIAPKAGSKRFSLGSLSSSSRRTSMSTSERRTTTSERRQTGGTSSRLDVGAFRSSAVQRNLARGGRSSSCSATGTSEAGTDATVGVNCSSCI